MDDRIRILIADDHALLRETLAQYLDSQPDMRVVAEAGTASATVEQAAVSDPHIILLDITMPGGSGISIIPELRQRAGGSRIVIMTMHDEPSYLRAAVAAGVEGYLVKSSPPTVLLEAVRAVKRGERFIDESMKAYLVAMPADDQGPDNAPIMRLSERERQVLIGLAQGLRYQTIAEQLGVSVKTVETYRSRLTAKLGFKTRADLMRFAIESGILTAGLESCVST
jgi:DNA-binding NarL/FixJ family response regulator